jgi:hypothetical protein
MDDQQAIIDGEQLRILSIAYFIEAGMSALFSLIGLFYVFMATFVSRAIAQAPASEQGPPPEFFAWFMATIGIVMFAVLIVFGILKLACGLQIRKRRSRIFCMIVAGITCLGFPYGTVLGVFTFIVLARPSVQKLFETPTAG